MKAIYSETIGYMKGLIFKTCIRMNYLGERNRSDSKINQVLGHRSTYRFKPLHTALVTLLENRNCVSLKRNL